MNKFIFITLFLVENVFSPVSDTCRKSRRFFESEWSGTKPFSTRGSSET